MQAVMFSSLLLLEAGITAVPCVTAAAFIPAVAGIPCCCWGVYCIPGVASFFAASIPADPDPILVGTYLCRASMHSFFIDFQSLRELRITCVLTIAITQNRCGWDSSLTAL
jgi:hypothetical protein